MVLNFIPKSIGLFISFQKTQDSSFYSKKHGALHFIPKSIGFFILFILFLRLNDMLYILDCNLPFQYTRQDFALGLM
jgi:hypothetical protein